MVFNSELQLQQFSFGGKFVRLIDGPRRQVQAMTFVASLRIDLGPWRLPSIGNAMRPLGLESCYVVLMQLPSDTQLSSSSTWC